MLTFVAYTLRNIIVKNEVDWVIFKKEVGFSVEVCVLKKKEAKNDVFLAKKEPIFRIFWIFFGNQ